MRRYPWPASALDASDMKRLHAVREAGLERAPISELIARAVRVTYAANPTPMPETTEPPEETPCTLPSPAES